MSKVGNHAASQLSEKIGEMGRKCPENQAMPQDGLPKNADSVVFPVSTAITAKSCC
jgi:hypothetical protein